MNYCSHCGAAVRLQMPPGDDRPRHVCRACGTVHYRNPVMVVGCIPQWEDKILLCRRNIEPRKGKWTLPAGYLEIGETVMEGARRETLEECGAAVIALDPYMLFDIVYVNQVYLMFRARLQTPDYKATAESSEVVLMREEEIPWGEIAFRVMEKTLMRFFEDRLNGDYPFRISQIHLNPF
jgi:ADP-ribose pyrophosphatase YjhB (NUDIX family)